MCVCISFSSFPSGLQRVSPCVTLDAFPGQPFNHQILLLFLFAKEPRGCVWLFLSNTEPSLDLKYGRGSGVDRRCRQPKVGQRRKRSSSIGTNFWRIIKRRKGKMLNKHTAERPTLPVATHTCAACVRARHHPGRNSYPFAINGSPLLEPISPFRCTTVRAVVKSWINFLNYSSH